MLKSRYNQLFVLLTLLSQVSVKPANAQITPANDGTNTLVNTTGQQINITGGTQAEQNLYHSFQQFGLNQGQIANFLSNPNIINILGRVTGGDASVINGLIQVTGGNSNLFLMNPAGIIFGNNASLNVPASFTATTANAIGVGNNWFNATGQNNYNLLTGNPNSFAFLNQNSGAILNTGNLITNQGSVTLLGGTVINTGTISTPNGNITIAATPGEKLVKISQEGSLLSLELPIDQSGLNQVTNTPSSLAQLLTLINVNHASGVTVENGQLKLTSINQVVPTETATNIISGNIQAKNTINILGDKIGIFNGNVSTLGSNGGNIFIGGDYQGKATLPTAQFTYIDPNSNIKAEGINGGNIIVWSDQATRIYGNLSVKGNNQGGFIETSSKGYLDITTVPDISGQSGGTWLIDPTDIDIVAGSGNTNIPDNNPFTATGDNASLGVDLIITALNNGNVTVATGSGGTQLGNISLNTDLNYSGATSTLELKAHGRVNINGNINSSVNPLNVILTGDSQNAGIDGAVSIYSNITTNGGNLTATGKTSVNGFAGLFVGSGININTGNGSINFTSTSSGTGTGSHGISIGGTLTTTLGNITLTGNSTNANGNAAGITIGNQITSNSGSITLTGTSAGSSNAARGISVGGNVSTNSGNITLTGNNTNANVDTPGILIANQITSNSGSITLTGTSAGNGQFARGIAVQSSVSTTSGNITLTGNNTNANSNAPGIVAFNPITSNSGSITLTGTSAGNGQFARGISVVSSVSTTSGNITLTGNNTNANGNAAGIRTFNQAITSNTGSITLTGTSAGNGISARGISVEGNVSTDSGNITLTGNNTNANGIAEGIFSNRAITSNAGNITLIGSSNSANGGVNIGSANITANSTSANVNISSNVGNIVLGNIQDSGNLTVTSAGTITQNAGTSITVANNANFTTTLANTGNVTVTNNNANGTVLGNSTIGGTFTLTSAGNVTQFSGENLQVAGNTSITANSFTASGNNNSLSRLTTNNGDLLIDRVGVVTLGNETITGNLTVNSQATGFGFNGTYG
ncbi:filamentous hemagglutinin N-terminal domain-containing protein, partial [Sphaerospermopsis sp. FACHB-1094]|uniref:beta strand repeat-containing protein n=1 Tax=Sphaerospermopsis sp. FACHB-1094 TaxID=2692861 RepID=UPI00168979E3